MTDKTIFQKIIDGDIAGKIEYQDDHCFALHDINPQAPVHLLIIPRKVIPHIADATADDQNLLGHLLLTARKLAKDLLLQDGFRIVINNGPKAGETVPHLHVHLIGGRQMTWPPG